MATSDDMTHHQKRKVHLGRISDDAAQAMARNTIRPLLDEEAAREAETQKWNNMPVGTVMPDGSVFAGKTVAGERLYAMPRDEDGLLTVKMAEDCAQRLNGVKAQGHDDWRLPTRDELTLLFNNRAKIGGFDTRGIGWPCGAYLSATEATDKEVWGRYFPKANEQPIHRTINAVNARCVRTGSWRPS